MDKLRSGEMTRKAVSFFLAVGLHALLFMIQASGYWGAGGDELGYTLIQPVWLRLNRCGGKCERNSQPQVTPKPPHHRHKRHRRWNNRLRVEQPLTKIEEVHQEKSAPRETQPEPGGCFRSFSYQRRP